MEGRKEGRAVFPRAFPDETLSRAMRAKKKKGRKEGRAVFPRAFPDETLSRAMRAKKKRKNYRNGNGSKGNAGSQSRGA